MAVAILFSCLIALTLTPMMASKLFARGIARGRAAHAIDAGFNWLAACYSRSLQPAMRRPWLPAGLCVLISVLAWSVYRQLPSEYTPERTAA